MAIGRLAIVYERRSTAAIGRGECRVMVVYAEYMRYHAVREPEVMGLHAGAPPCAAVLGSARARDLNLFVCKQSRIITLEGRGPILKES